jgi:hypothetical protein
MTVKHNSFCYNLLPQGYMFRLLRVILRPSTEQIQNYLITSALWDPVALTIGGVVVHVHVTGTNIVCNKVYMTILQLQSYKYITIIEVQGI